MEMITYNYTVIIQHGQTGPDGVIVLGSVVPESGLVNADTELTV